MATMVSELHSGDHVRTYISAEDGAALVAAYVSRGFDLVENVTAKTVKLASGAAVVIVTKDV